MRTKPHPTNSTMHYTNILQRTIFNRIVHAWALFWYKLVHCFVGYGIGALCDLSKATILQMSQQLSSSGICKLVTWSNHNFSQMSDQYSLEDVEYELIKHLRNTLYVPDNREQWSVLWLACIKSVMIKYIILNTGKLKRWNIMSCRIYEPPLHTKALVAGN